MKSILMLLPLLLFAHTAFAEVLSANTPIHKQIEYGEWHHYEIPLTADMSNLKVSLTGLSADADLYTRNNKRPSPWFWRWDCRPYESADRSEHCSIASGNKTLHISINGSSRSGTPYTLSVSSEAAKPETVYLLLHGLNSDPDTWNAVSDTLFNKHCPTLKGDDRDLSLASSNCYRYHFSTRADAQKNVWENGDGSQYSQLGDEVGLALSSIELINKPKAIVLVGHSRGGLAARAFLQSAQGNLPYHTALLTIGTPHQGSPFGLIKHWMKQEGYRRSDIFFSALHFVASPSVGFLTSVLGDDGTPINDTRSAAIHQLNNQVSNLTGRVDVFGQITSSGLALGENAAGYLDLLHGASAAFVLPGDLSDLADYVETNLHQPEWKTGDGIVPHESQFISRIAGFNPGSAKVWHAQLDSVPHADATQFDFWDSTPNDGETGQTAIIQKMLETMTSTPGFDSFD